MLNQRRFAADLPKCSDGGRCWTIKGFAGEGCVDCLEGWRGSTKEDLMAWTGDRSGLPLYWIQTKHGSRGYGSSLVEDSRAACREKKRIGERHASFFYIIEIVSIKGFEKTTLPEYSLSAYLLKLRIIDVIVLCFIQHLHRLSATACVSLSHLRHLSPANNAEFSHAHCHPFRSAKTPYRAELHLSEQEGCISTAREYSLLHKITRHNRVYGFTVAGGMWCFKTSALINLQHLP